MSEITNLRKGVGNASFFLSQKYKMSPNSLICERERERFQAVVEKKMNIMQEPTNTTILCFQIMPTPSDLSEREKTKMLE